MLLKTRRKKYLAIEKLKLNISLIFWKKRLFFFPENNSYLYWKTRQMYRVKKIF